MALRHYSNAPATTLAASCTALDTTIQVASASGFPIAYPYTLILDWNTNTEEVVLVTGASGTTLTVTRGHDATTAFAHVLGAQVVHGVSAEDARDANTHVHATSGVHGLTGAPVGTTDNQTLTSKIIGASNTLNGFTPLRFMQSDANGRIVSGIKPIPTGDVVGTTDVQTVTNKVLGITNNINGFTANRPMQSDGTGRLIASTKLLPTGEFVGTTDTQTLTNKTLSGGTVSGATITNPVMSGGTIASSTDISLANTVTSGLATSATGWVSQVYGALFMDQIVFIKIVAQRSGANITSGASGNINTSGGILATSLNASYRPSLASVYGSYTMNDTSFGTLRITTSGTIELLTLHTGATLNSGEVVTATLAYAKGF